MAKRHFITAPKAKSIYRWLPAAIKKAEIDENGVVVQRPCGCVKETGHAPADLLKLILQKKFKFQLVLLCFLKLNLNLVKNDKSLQYFCKAGKNISPIYLHGSEKLQFQHC